MPSFLAAQKLEEAKREARRRGDKKTQTSDAKFDEKFQVGHGISGEANKPWYAKSSSMLQPEEAPGLQVRHARSTSEQDCICNKESFSRQASHFRGALPYNEMLLRRDQVVSRKGMWVHQCAFGGWLAVTV